jgi:hypothetical protein
VSVAAAHNHGRLQLLLQLACADAGEDVGGCLCLKAGGAALSAFARGLGKAHGIRSLPRGRGAGGVDKSAQLSSPIVAPCLLRVAGACCNATSRRNTQGREVTVGRLV